MAQHFLEGRLSAFVEDAERLLSEPSAEANPSILINLAAAQFELGLYRKCIRSCESALLATPQSLQAHRILGKAFVALNRKTDAITTWELALKTIDIATCDILIAREISALLAAHNMPAIDRTPVEPATPPPAPTPVPTPQVQPIAPTPLVVADESKVVPASSSPKMLPVPALIAQAAAANKAAAAAAATTAVTLPATAVKAVPKAAPPLLAKAVALPKPAAPPAAPAAATPSPAPTSTVSVSTKADTTTPTKSPGKLVVVPVTSPSAQLSNHDVDVEDLIQSVQTFPDDNKIIITLNHSDGSRPVGPSTPEEILIKDYYRSMKKSGDPAVMRAPLISAMKSNLPHLTMTVDIDNLIALAYLEINSTHYDRALEILNFTISHDKKAVSAWIGRGSIYAMQRSLTNAVNDFTEAIHANRGIAEAWKRRGQTRAAMNCFKEGLSDLTKGITLAPKDADIYYQRGLIYHQIHYYSRALGDYRQAEALGQGSAILYNLIGQAEGQLGNIKESIAAHLEALKLDESFKEAYLNIALVYKEAGDTKNALAYLDRCQADTASAKKPLHCIYLHKSHVYYAMGHIGAALEMVKSALNILYQLHSNAAAPTGINTAAVPAYSFSQNMLTNSTNAAWIKQELLSALTRAAACYQSLGIYNKALVFYEQILRWDKHNSAWYARELLLVQWNYTCEGINNYNNEEIVPCLIKDAMSMGQAVSEYYPKHVSESDAYVPTTKPVEGSICCLEDDGLEWDRYAATVDRLKADAASGARPSPTTIDRTYSVQYIFLLIEKDAAVRASFCLTSVLLLDCPGFINNRRQRRSFGLGVLQAVAALREHLWGGASTSGGLTVLDYAGSRSTADLIAAGKPASITPSSSSSAGSTKRASLTGVAAGKAKTSKGTRAYNPRMSLHRLGWRDLMDIFVRWRQVCEPTDSVYYIDRMPAAAFARGYGLQTPIVSKGCRSVRYYPYASATLALLKHCLGCSPEPAADRPAGSDDYDIFPSRGFYYTVADVAVRVTAEQLALLQAATTSAEVWAILGEDFYVSVPYFSIAGTFQHILHTLGGDAGHVEPDCPSACEAVHEGTRLTVLRVGGVPGSGGQVGGVEGEGYDFTVRTPSTPARWAAFDKEMEYAFEIIEEVLKEAKDVPEKQHKVLLAALCFYYAFVVFSPLTRGSAFCALAALQAVLVTHGYMVSTTQGVQLDWEALLSTNVSAFIQRALAVLTVVPIDPSAQAELSACMNLLQDERVGTVTMVLEAFGTTKDMLHGLALPYKDAQ